MTLQQIVDELAHGARGTFTAMFDISDAEAERIAEKCETAAEFQAIWENEDWWADANN